jgi:cytoskeletal protein RodZ
MPKAIAYRRMHCSGSRGLDRMVRICLIFAVLLVTAHRLPAPISEIPESPTPAPEQSAKPKSKRTIKPEATGKSSESSTKRQSTSSPQSQSTPNRTPFAGTWQGTLSDTGGANGVSATLIVNPTQDSAVVIGLAVWGDRRGRASAQGNTLSWTFLAEKWTMVIAPDGKTAVVTDHGWPAGVSSGTFKKMP